MMNEIRSGGTYLSQSDLRLRFGLGDAGKADKVIIRWPDGHEDTLTDVSGGRLVVVAYGGKIVSATNYRAAPETINKA
jgi:hypothetical protein